MKRDFACYLQELRARLRLEPDRETEVLEELYDHLEERTHELEKQGAGHDEASGRAALELGEPRLLAKELYAVYSKSSWAETSVALLPHILFSLLFALHLWATSISMVLLLISTTLVSFLAWKMGRPRWIYPWLGYCLLPPVIAWFIAGFAIGNSIWGLAENGNLPIPIWLFVAAICYIPIALKVVWAVWFKLVKRDWFFASLTLLPFPFLVSWLIFVQNNGGLFSYNSYRVSEADSATALIFLGMALATAVIYRTETRFIKVASLIFAIPVLSILTAMGYVEQSLVSGVVLLSIVSLCLLLLPALLEMRLGNDDRHRMA